MLEINNLTIVQNTTIRDSLKRLESGGQGILLLVDAQGRLLRTVTDGDLRRLILSGFTLDDTLHQMPLLPPKTVSGQSDPIAALELMNRHQIDQLPVIDPSGKPCGLWLRRDIDTRILLSTPHLGEWEMGFVEEAFRTNWVAPLGPNVDAFEKELADYVGIGHAAALSSGTAALHLALRLLDVGPGHTVFCSTLTFVASVNPILYQGARPVFIDSEPSTWNMSPQALERAFHDAQRNGLMPKAVIVVNLYGQSADMAPIMALCERYGVPIVEDAAESLGATYQGKHSGTFGHLGVYSFNGNKIITTSGGGMLISEDGELIERARFLATQARDNAPWYQHSEVGYNYRMSNILAGIGRGQLKVLEDRVISRRQVFQCYMENLAHIPALQWMPEAGYGRATRWLTVCTLEPKRTDITPAQFIAELARKGIEARHVWKPMHMQPLFSGCAYYPHEEGAGFSGHAFAAGVCLPSGSNMALGQQERIIATISQLF